VPENKNETPAAVSSFWSVRERRSCNDVSFLGVVERAGGLLSLSGDQQEQEE